MTGGRRTGRARRWLRRVGLGGGLLVAVAGLGLLWLVRAQAIPVLNPIYQIETVSNGYSQSLPLNMGRPGVPQVPRPVDVNHDGIQDIIVSVNLVDVRPLLQLPPDAPAVLEPQIEITRNPAAVALCKPDISLLNKCTPPLKILIKFTITDSNGLQDDTVVSFGYDTGNNGSLPGCTTAPCPDKKGRIGSIPPYFKAAILGLENFYNPITAQVTTQGYAIVGPTLIDQDVKNGYEGPLDLVGSVGTAEGPLAPANGGFLNWLANLINPQDEPTADLRFGYRPWPGTITVSYGSDDEGDHITYDHSRMSGVDLNTHVGIFSRDGDVLESTELDARIDRLPRHITLDLATDESSGKVRYHARSDGRRPDISLSSVSEKLQVVQLPAPPPTPDVQAKLNARLAGFHVQAHANLFIGLTEPAPEVQLVPLEAPLIADVDIESFPDTVEGRWSFPTGGPVSALFCGGEVDDSDQCAPSGQGVGAVDAHVQDFYAAPSVISPFVATEQQHLSFRNAPGGVFGTGESLITGRVDQIRELRFDQSDQGFSARTRLGDGELPLEIDFGVDTRQGTEGALVNAGATIVPLPDDITVSMTQPGEDQKTQPLQFVYDSSKSVDINSKVNIRTATGGPTCGNAGTICGTLNARHIPAHIDVRVRTFPSDIADDNTNDEFADSRVEIDSIPRPFGAKPDFFADLTLGQTDDTPTNFADDIPLVAHGELLGFPKFVRIRAREGADETLDRVEFHACDWDYEAGPPACAQDPTGRIGSLSFKLRNWITRPAGLPILTPATPLYATLAVRGRPSPSTDVDFEATGKVTDISELQYRNTQKVFGLQSRVGANQDFSAKVDVANLDFPDDDPTNGRIDAKGVVTIQPLPGQMDFCFRDAHETIQTLTDDFTDACETDNPFADQDPLSESPTTVHYHANSPFTVTSDLTLVQQGPSAAQSDDHTVKGHLHVANLPAEVTVNLQTPEEGVKGLIRGLYDAPPSSPPFSVDLSASATDGDLVCEDPRTPPVDKKAMCLAATIVDLPTHAFFRYDPTIHEDNFEIRTNTQISISNLRLSSVEGVHSCEPVSLTCPLSLYQTIIPKILVGQATITDLPSVVEGTLDLPKEDGEAPTVDITATPALGAIDATVQNFIAPNPFVKPIPTRTVSGFGAPTQTATFRQRGTSFLATAHIEDVKRVGYRTVKADDGTPLETKVMNLDFGHGTEVIRAYADIMESPAAQVIADAVLNDVPAGLQVCFRGDANDKSPATGTATYCDVGDTYVPVANTDGKDQASGALQFKGTPDTPNASPLDVDAFVRFASGGGTQVLAGRVHIDNIPFIVEGTFPTDADTGQLDIGGFKPGVTPGTLVPDGIDKIEVNAASFDLQTADTGFSASDVPYEPRFNNRPPFPLTATSNQHLKAALVDSDFNIRARIGPESQVQRVKMLRVACPVPAGTHPDYPLYPNGPDDKYTCIQGVFDPSQPDDQLDLQFHMEKDGSIISVNDAGLTDIPSTVQMTLAETPLFSGPGDNLRQRCGTISQSPVNGGDCMPPLLRFDQPSNSVLWGTARIGTAGDLAKLEPTAIPVIAPRPEEDMADLDAAPTSTSFPGWETPPAGVPANKGVRAKIVGFEGGRTAVKAGIRLAIPQSLTVDQIQSWSDSDNNGQENYWEASDTRFHYIVRDSSGNPVGSLGQLSLMKQSEDGTQILASAPCLSDYGPRADDPGDCDDFKNGISIPGELGIDIYQRNHTGRGKDFMQIDGRLSQLKDTNGNNVAFNLGARIVGGGPKPSIGRLEGVVKNVPQGGSPGDPSFRLRIEMLGEGEAPPTGAAGGGGDDEEGEENCSIFLCAITDVQLKSIYALFDFKSARRVEAVVNQKGATSQGMEVKSFDAVTGGNPTPILVKALLDVNPINVFLHAGLPLIGGADLVLMSQLQAGLTLDTQHFTLRHNTLHVEASNEGPNKSVIGPINYYIYVLHGSAYALFVKLFGVDFLPPSLPPDAGLPPGPPSGPVQIVFLSCDAGDLFSQLLDIGDTVIDPFGGSPLSNALEVGSSGSVSPSDHRNVVIWPFLDPRIEFSGVFGFLGNLAKIIGPFFCFTDTSASNIPLMTGGVPGDPVGSAFLPNHNGPPGAADDSTPPPGPGPSTVPAPPSFDDSGNLALCGTHTFTNLTIDNTLTVATTASTAESTTPDIQDCPADSVGTLTIVADQVTVNGTITGSAVWPFLQPDGTPPTGNSGGGHGGKGGDGSSGSGGTTYDDVDDDGLDNVSGNDDDGRPTLVGGRGRGGGDFTSQGGGSIEIQARDVTVNGQIIARGGDGANGATGTGGSCSGATSGNGGGSGGRIVIDAFNVDNNGTISVSGGFGGSGGAGGGGGGGAGRLQIGAPLLSGTSGIFASGRSGGTDTCSGNGDDDGSSGDSWNLDVGPGEHLDTSPKSVVRALSQFWNRDESGANLHLPYEAAAAGGNDNGVQVLICGYRKAPSDITGSGSLNDQFPVTPPSLSGIFGIDVCGGSQRLVVDSFSADRQSVNAATSGSDMTDGYWGTWSIAFSPPDPDYDCLDGSIFDFFVCQVEPIPDVADLVIGIDNSDPGLDIDPPADNPTGPDFITNTTTIKLSPAANDQNELSGLKVVECSNDGTNFFTCNNGENDWVLDGSGADGDRTVTVRATDFAGNETTLSRTGLLDRTLPTQSVSVSGVTFNTWYNFRPTITLDGSDPGGSAASGLASPPFHYRFDEGSEEDCSTAAPCAIDQGDVNALFVGAHTLHFTAQDIAGNRLFDDDDAATPSPMKTKAIKIDDEKPLSALNTVPRAPNGANGWFVGRPWIVISAIDQPGASGISNIKYTLNGGSPITYTGPFQLAPGSYTFCWFATDVAGNVEPTQCTDPTKPIKVDDAIPSVSITAPGPDGLNGWYKTSPTATVTASDPSPGSSVNPAFDPNLSDLCTGGTPAENPTAPSGLCVSLDDGAFQPVSVGLSKLVTVAEGLHTIRAFAVDVSGQTSPVVEAAYMVDRSEPVTAGRLIPPSPALSPWWRRIPRVVLRSTDGERNAGVQKIEYFIDGIGPTIYSGPFSVPSGVHTVTFKATDLAGRVETLRTMSVKVDIGPAVVRALSSNPLAFVPAKGQKTQLRWTVTDDLSHSIRATVLVYNNLGLVVRRLVEAAPRTVSPNVTSTFYTVWDGKDDGLAGLVPIGTYYYRVIVTDEAGNISMTGESAPLTVKAT